MSRKPRAKASPPKKDPLHHYTPWWGLTCPGCLSHDCGQLAPKYTAAGSHEQLYCCYKCLGLFEQSAIPDRRFELIKAPQSPFKGERE